MAIRPGEDEPRDDIERELEQLRGFGSTLALGLAASTIVVAIVTLLLWLTVL